MKKFKSVSRETSFFFLVVLLIFSQININAVDNIGIEANSSVLVDYENGSIYNSSNLHDEVGIASITKLMTVDVAYDLMEEQGIEFSDMVPISDRAINIKLNVPAASGLYYNYGEEISYEDAFNLILVLSDNGVAISVAEALAGSEEAFVELMMQKASELGMNNTHFYNVSGLTMYDYTDDQVPGTDPSDYNTSSSFDIALLTKNLVDNHPEVLEITSQPYLTYEGNTYNTYNLMLENQTFEYTGVQGMKTGTSDEALYSFVGFYDSKVSDDKYISVILGANSGGDRFNQTSYMYNWIDLQDIDNIIDTENKWELNIEGDNSTEKIDLYPLENISSTSNLKIDGSVNNYTYNSDYFDENNNLINDIPAGEVVATMELKTFEVTDGLENLYHIQEEEDYQIITIPLVSRETIEKGANVTKAYEVVKTYFVGLFNDII